MLIFVVEFMDVKSIVLVELLMTQIGFDAILEPTIVAQLGDVVRIFT